MRRILSVALAAIVACFHIAAAFFREHVAAVTFTVSSVLLLAIASWYERVLICLSLLSGAIVALRVANYDGLPSWLA